MNYNFIHWFANQPGHTTNWIRYNYAFNRKMLDPVLHKRHDIPDDLWNALSARLDAKMMMELMFLVGSYTLLAWVLRTVRMPLEDLID